MAFLKNLFDNKKTPNQMKDMSVGLSDAVNNSSSEINSKTSTISNDTNFSSNGSLGNDPFKDYDSVSTDYENYLRDDNETPISFKNTISSQPPKVSPEEMQKKVNARKIELEASRKKQEQLAIESNKLKEQSLVKIDQQSELLESQNERTFNRIDKLDRILSFFSPLHTLVSAVPVVGEIFDILGEYIIKFKDDRALIALGDLIFNVIEQMFGKIAEMQKLYEKSPNTASGKLVPDEFMKLTELLEEMYITLLSMVLTEQRVNLMAQKLKLNEQYKYQNSQCGDHVLQHYKSNCSFSDKILALVDSRQTVMPKISENKNKSATSWVISKIKNTGKSIYRYGIADKMISQLQSLITRINTAFMLALTQYVMDVKGFLEDKIDELRSSAASDVARIEAIINVENIRTSISDAKVAIDQKDIRESYAAAGGKMTQKMRARKTMKQNRNKKTHKQR